MDTHQENGPGHSSAEAQLGRRLACDRCRAQKLKCERSNIRDVCQRCRRADTQCSFGRPLPSGRPRTNTAAHTRQSQSTARTVSSSDTETAASPIHGQVDQCLEHREPDDRGRATPMSSTSGTTNNDSITAIASPPWQFDLSTNLGDEEMDEILYDNGFATGFDLDPAFSSWTAPAPATSTPVQSHVHNARDVLHVHTQTKPNTIPFSYHQSRRPSPKCPANLLETLKKVTQLGNTMNELHTKYSLKQHALQEHGAFPVDLSGDVLQVTNDFLTILNCFYLDDAARSSNSSATTSSEATPTVARRDHLYTPPEPSTTFGQQIADSRANNHESFQAANAGMTAHFSTTNAWQQAQHPPPPAARHANTDKPAALQLIASHQRLLDLHLLFHKAVYDYLCSTHGHATSPIWQDLALGSALLGQSHFADLHIRLVLQAMARVLSKVEGALGLSGGCRVSTKSVVEGTGILGSIVSADFVDMCMAEEGTGTEQGRGAITRIREISTHVARMLDTQVPGTG